jgi:2-C-methyl-D-erythritol 4-phosphate cytidylyltransferase
VKVIALVPAAGMGKRMGVGFNKQYILLGGQPIVGRTLQVFERLPLVDEIHVIVPEEEIPYCKEHVVRAGGFTKVRSVLAGGKERQNSVLNGLRALDGCAEDDVVVIHDGVRPFVTAEMIERSVEVAREFDGALVAVPAKDTVKVVEDGVIVDTPPRERIWLAQTPQTFRYGVIRAAHEVADAERFLGTDDASLVERLGRKVHVVSGDYRNIKLTTPEDLMLAEAFLRHP